jgi:hypothetical protein
MATSNLSRATVIIWQRLGTPPVVSIKDQKAISVLVNDYKNAEAQIIAEYLRIEPLPSSTDTAANLTHLQNLIKDIAGGLVTIADVRTVAITVPS